MRLGRLVAAAAALGCVPALPVAAQRAPVLRQIKVPHPYYFREMLIPQVTSGPGAATWSPDGRELIYPMQGSLWRQRVGSNSARQLTDGPGYDAQPDWSPDGRRVVYASYRNDAVGLHLLDLSSGTTAPLVANGAVNFEPRWSPDGRRIAYTSSAYEGRWHVFTVEVSEGGAAPVRVTEDRDGGLPRYYYGRFDQYLSPSWSPDGRELLVISNRGHIWGSGGFWRVRATPGSGGREIRYEETTWRASPDWGRDGRIAYASYLGRQWHQLWLMTGEGGDPIQLTYGEFDATSPRWSPAGDRLSYVSNEGGNTSLWVVGVPGGDREQVRAARRTYLAPVGRLTLRIVDSAGRTLPARVSVRDAGDRSWAPDDAWRHADDGFDRAERRFEYGYFHSDGRADLTVPAGRLEVEISRGPESEGVREPDRLTLAGACIGDTTPQPPRDRTTLSSRVPDPDPNPRSPRMTIPRLLSAALVAAAILPGPLDAQVPRPIRPRLVVVIAVDQLRGDYMDRFRPYFAAGGFNLFLTRGARFAQARYEHGTTSTCPGHAVILTGSYGTVNGIVGNDWYDVRTGREVYCVEDPSTKLVGSGAPGRSPRNLFGATIGDVLKMATAGRSRVLTISAKDRSAIMLGGHLADAAYWIVDTLVVTSTYYRPDLPAWAREFNASGAISKYFGKRWERILPAAAYQGMGPDDEPAEADEAGMGRVFPHPIRDADAFDQSPFLNDVLAEFAERAVTAEGLGRDSIPDLLGISFSANDRVGHTFGPESHEVMDVTVRLDRTLRDLFAFLDRSVGLANTLIVLTADHGVAPMPETLQRLHPGAAARRLDPQIVDTAVRRALDARFGSAPAPGWILYHNQPWIHLNRAALARAHVPLEAAEQVARDAVLAVPGVHEALTGEELARARSVGAATGAALSYYAGRSGDIFYSLLPYWTAGGRYGADHGSVWRYDQQVPLLWFGAGIAPGVRQEAAQVADIAPTLAALLGLIQPAGAEGRVLTEILR